MRGKRSKSIIDDAITVNENRDGLLQYICRLIVGSDKDELEDEHIKK